MVEIHVLQGERELAPDNITLDKFYLHDIEPQPRGEARLEVVFDIDANGMVHVSAIDLQQDTVTRIRIEAACQPPADVVERMLAQSQEKMESDQRRRQEIEGGIRGENLILATEKLVGDMGETPVEKVRQAAEAAEIGVTEVRAALADGRLERMTSANETLEALLRRLDLAIKRAKQQPAVAQEAVA